MKGKRIRKIGIVVLLLITVAAVTALSGCSGGTGPAGATGATGPAAGTDAAILSTDQLATMTFADPDELAKNVSVTISSPPVVKFKVTDAAGNGIKGLGWTTKSNTTGLTGLSNIAFTLAKLVPGENGSPDYWESYIVSTMPTATSPTVVATRPTSDSNGTLKDNGDGTYEYTFGRDITKIKDLDDTVNNTKVSVIYEPTRTHRLVIQIGGAVRGTGTNNSDGTNTNTGVPTVRFKNPINIVYDFIPATGRAIAAADLQRNIVRSGNCFECHGKFTFHGGSALTGEAGSRQDTRFCVTCHTDQRRIGRTEAATDSSGNFTADATTSGTYIVDGRTTGNFPNYIHKLHMGEELTKTGYNYGGVKLNEVTFPQDLRNCRKCHTESADTPQGDNWKNKPSRLACGSCHDQVNFATGAGHAAGLQSNDVGCAVCHDASYIELKHLPVAAPNPDNILAGGTVSITNAAWIAPYLNLLPAGASTITYDISSVSADASKHPVVKFKLKKDGADVVFNTYSATGKTELIDTFVGSPSAYFVWAVPQDGITAPADFNASVNSYIKRIWNGTATGTAAGTITGPDTSGYYTITLTGVTIPANAVMLTGGIGFEYSLNVSATTTKQPLTQTDLADYPYDAANKTGGLIVRAPVAWKVATGYTGRRIIVENARCEKCHAQLGVTPTFHAGQRNDAQVCAWCHRPNQTSSGWSARSGNYIHGIHGAKKRTVDFTWHAPSATEGYWEITFPGILKNCETCHLPGTYDFSTRYTRTSNTASIAATTLDDASRYTLMNSLPYSTVATGTWTASDDPAKGNYKNGTSYSWFVGPAIASKDEDTTKVGGYTYGFSLGTSYGTGFSYDTATGVVTAEATGDTLVTSPIATACFSCHDTSLAKQHMEGTGAGSIYRPRATALSNTEQCLLCHGPGKIAAIKEVHNTK